MPDRLISHYRLVRRLGAGGMGEVFLAHDTQLDRPVALKVMSTQLAADPNQRRRFRTEAKAASGLNHAHICVIHEVGEAEDGRPFLAMEYVEGQTLDVVLQERRLKIREVLNLVIEVAEALEAAHARDLVHRDIKPGNIMLDARGHAKVLDFGLAKRFAADELGAAMTSAAHTQTGMLIGTPQYMSPEQALGHEIGPGADLFSLGVVLYELVAGQRPFAGTTLGETINNIVNHPPPPLGLENPVFSPALDNIIFKCLEKEPGKRYSSATELAADLRKLREDSDRALAATTQAITPVPAARPAGEPPHTALWQLATKAKAGGGAAVGWTLGFIVLAVLGAGGWVLLRGGGTKVAAPAGRPAVAAQQKSVAVLPFVNLSADKADEYLSDGMTDELLNALAEIPELRVPGRSSSFAFKGKTEENIFLKVGKQLRVGAVLEGSVRKAGNQVRITAQLISVADGFQLWSETYDRDMTNIFAIQSDIASRVAEALKVKLLGRAPAPTENLEAYKFYLQGRYLWNRRTGESLKLAIEHFNQAIARDPTYALAYAGLADCYTVLDGYTGLPGRETFPKARAAALKALEQDASLAEPRVALAFIKAYVNWDWSGAEAEFRRAIESKPKYATAHHWLGRVLLTLRRPEEALAELRQAQDIDPLSPIINVNVAEALFYVGKADSGIELLKEQIALDPSFVTAHRTLAWLYLDTGKLSEFHAEHETVRGLVGQEDHDLDSLGVAQARAGKTNEARVTLDRMAELQRQGRDYRLPVAMVQHALGDNDAALDSLEEAVEERAGGLAYLNFSPQWNDLRPHPRFQAILRTMNLAN